MLLLDQRIVRAWQIYVCEALFGRDDRARRAARSAAQSGCAGQAIPQCLEMHPRRRLDLKDFAAPDGELGYFSRSSRSYDREGSRAVCAGK
jgi:formamidopyrimidine-DNA glycosylase